MINDKSIKYLGLLAAGTGLTTALPAQQPNIVIIMTDQQRADICGREGFPMDVTPFADRMAGEGVWFDRAYTTAPASVPARTSFLTGRFPKATRVKSNHNGADAVYEADIFSVARGNGYKTAMIGKNHTYLRSENADYWSSYGHFGKDGKDKPADVEEFEMFFRNSDSYGDPRPNPAGYTMQQPYRMVTEALDWIGGLGGDPFLMWLSFPEPHNPYQVSEPYYSMFSPDSLPKEVIDNTWLTLKGDRYVHLKEMLDMGHVGYGDNLDELRSFYIGMIRLIDDQMARFADGVKQEGLYDNTVFVITSDHGDYAGRYGLMKKGVGLNDALARIPMVWKGPGVAPTGRTEAHMSIADIFPTLCEMMGAEIPIGVQGRSLVEVLEGDGYPEAEFRSVIMEDGYGGQYYTKEDGTDYRKEGALMGGNRLDCMNTWTQSGMRRAVRMGDWKLEFDMLGEAYMYNMSADPLEVTNLYGDPAYASKQTELLAELLKWEIATEDPLPIPRRRYRFKRNPHNYLWTPAGS